MFILDTDVLGGNELNYYETIVADRGRSITVDWQQVSGGQDIEILGYSIRYFPTEETAQE